MRRGYKGELKAKKELEKEFKVGNVIKTAIGGAQDYLVVGCGELIKVIEVKEIHKKSYYPSPKEKLQFERIIKFAKQHRIVAELWIYRFSGTGKPIIKTIKILKD